LFLSKLLEVKKDLYQHFSVRFRIFIFANFEEEKKTDDVLSQISIYKLFPDGSKLQLELHILGLNMCICEFPKVVTSLICVSDVINTKAKISQRFSHISAMCFRCDQYQG